MVKKDTLVDLLYLCMTTGLLLRTTNGQRIMSKIPQRTKTVANFNRRQRPIATDSRIWNYVQMPRSARTASTRYGIQFRSRHSLTNPNQADLHLDRRSQDTRLAGISTDGQLFTPGRTRAGWPTLRGKLSEAISPRHLEQQTPESHGHTQQSPGSRIFFRITRKRMPMGDVEPAQRHQGLFDANIGRGIHIVHNGRNAQFIVKTRGRAARVRIYNRGGSSSTQVTNSGRFHLRSSDPAIDLPNLDANNMEASTHARGRDHAGQSNELKLRAQTSGTTKIKITTTRLPDVKTDSTNQEKPDTIPNDSKHSTAKLSVHITRTRNPPVTHSIIQTTIHKAGATSQLTTSQTNKTATRGIIPDEPDLPDMPDLPDVTDLPRSD